MNAFNGSYTSASGEETSHEIAVQVSERGTSLSAVSYMPRALYSSVNAEALRMMLLSGYIAPSVSALPTTESMDSAQRAKMMQIYGLNVPENNITSTQLQTTEQLQYAKALRIADLVRTGRYSLPSARSIPSIDQQIRLLIQEQQARQTLAVAASNIAASRNASYCLVDPRVSQSLTEYLKLRTRQQKQQQQQHHQKQQQQILLGALIQAQAGLQAGNRARDHPTPTPSSTVPTLAPISIPPPFGRYGKVELFPGKLYRLLAEAERDSSTHIVSFTPDGKAFKIHDPGAFIKDVSPRYFRQSLMSSFVRQLNFYGFDRHSRGLDIGAFAHPYFIRGRPELLDKIQRQNVTSTRAKKGCPSLR